MTKAEAIEKANAEVYAKVLKTIDNNVRMAWNAGYDAGKAEIKFTEEDIDKAYQRGYDAGYNAVAEDRINDAKAAYQRGLDDAWKAAGKIVLDPEYGGLKFTELVRIFGFIDFRAISETLLPQEIVTKLREYEERQKKPVKTRRMKAAEVLGCTVEDLQCAYDSWWDEEYKEPEE